MQAFDRGSHRCHSYTSDLSLIGNGILTITRVCDRAGGCKVYLQKRVLIHSNVRGDHIPGASFFDEDQSVTSRAAHRHLGSSGVKQPFPAVQSCEIVLQDCITRNISSNKNLKCVFLKKNKFLIRFQDVRKFSRFCLFVFICEIAQNWHCAANTLLGAFRTLVYVVCLPIWQETTENKLKD